MQTLIKNGTLITASETYQADILIEGETILQIGRNLQSPNAETIDAQGKMIFPGGVDPHTHFDLPMFDTVSSDDHYTGHKAAAFGGTTTVMDFVSLDFDTFEESVGAWRKKAGKAACPGAYIYNYAWKIHSISFVVPERSSAFDCADQLLERRFVACLFEQLF